MVDQLIHNTGGESQKYFDNLNMYFLPVANPDGYEFSRTDQRLWRKTRSNYGTACTGVDPNRNFGYHWAEVGSESNPCSEIYHGPSAFSEIEVANIRDFHNSLSPRPWLSQCIHSYGQKWLYPYCWKDGETQPYPNNETAVSLIRYI